MLSTTLLAALALAPQGGGSSAPVVINEFQYDDSGTDDREYVELFNRSGAPVDISGWVLDSRDQVGPNLAYTVPAGTVLQPGGYWVMGSALVPNVNQVVGTTNIWENDQESLELKDNNGRLIDSVVYEANKALFATTGIAEGEGVWGNFSSIDGIETSWSRLRDGWDSDDNGDDFRMMAATPGASNDRAPVERAQLTFDGAAVGAAVAEFCGGFALPHVIDPTVADVENPNAIPPSPQGGNAAIFWDHTGGGNSNGYVADAATDMHVEAYVYFDAVPRPAAAEFEMWSLGLGTTCTYYNFPDPTGTLGFTANGNTGPAWTYVVNDQGATLFLVDYNNGGSGPAALSQPVVLGRIAIQQGVNDGWQRLSLTISGTSLTGRFGGSYGTANGTTLTGTVPVRPRGVYVGYREIVVNNAAARPFTCDNLLITQCGTHSTRTVGTAIQNGAGLTPAIGVSAAPSLGSPFDVTATNLVASATAYLFIGVERTTPITLGAFGPAGFAFWVDFLEAPVAATGPTGGAAVTQQYPANPGLCGIELAYQWLQLDPALGAPIPLFHTEALVVHLGQ